MRKTILILTALLMAPGVNADKLDDFVYEFSAKAKDQFKGQISSDQFIELEDEGGRASQNMVDEINKRFGKYVAPAIQAPKRDSSQEQPESDAVEDSYQVI